MHSPPSLQNINVQESDTSVNLEPKRRDTPARRCGVSKALVSLVGTNYFPLSTEAYIARLSFHDAKFETRHRQFSPQCVRRRWARRQFLTSILIHSPGLISSTTRLQGP